VFYEPKLESGFPDAVIVYWAPAIAERWAPQRARLSVADLRGYQWILAQGTAELEHEQLAIELPFTREPEATIARLVAAELLREHEDHLWVVPLASTFAVTRLIAIEAKIKEPSRGLLQAARNGWFASETYLLAARLSHSPEFQERARSMGVGLIGRDDPIELIAIAAERRSLPLSYASWLFNEWAWRAARRPATRL
jgi:hypothetical protein